MKSMLGLHWMRRAAASGGLWAGWGIGEGEGAMGSGVALIGHGRGRG